MIINRLSLSRNADVDHQSGGVRCGPLGDECQRRRKRPMIKSMWRLRSLRIAQCYVGCNGEMPLGLVTMVVKARSAVDPALKNG